MSRALLICSILGSLFLTGCVEPQQGSLVIYIGGTPHPDYETLEVTLQSVRVVPLDGQAPAGLPVGGGKVVDLQSFQQEGTSALVANDTAAPRRYSAVLLEMSGVNGVRADGNEVTFRLDPETRVVTVPFNVTEGRTTRIVLVFDVQRSVQDEGDIPSFTSVLADVQVDENAERLERSIPDDGVPPRDTTSPSATTTTTTALPNR